MAFSIIKVQPLRYHQAQAVGPPTQPTEARFEPYFDTHEVIEDLQGGTIREGWLLGGNPYEARLHSALGDGYELGDPHQFFPDHYVIRRHFTYKTHAKLQKDRVTLLDMTWQKIPCPNRLAVDFGTVLVAQPTWWTYDNPPKNLTRALAGESVVRPLTVATFRMPLLAENIATFVSLAEQVGTRNKGEFLFRPEGFWFFEDLRVRHLWGNIGPLEQQSTPDPTNSRWEISLVFKGDPWRHHARWKAIVPDRLVRIPEEPLVEGEQLPDDLVGFLPVRPLSNSFEDMRAAHREFQPHPISTRPFLEDIDVPVELCSVPDLTLDP